jgi:hypothetical protein
VITQDAQRRLDALKEHVRTAANIKIDRLVMDGLGKLVRRNQLSSEDRAAVHHVLTCLTLAECIADYARSRGQTALEQDQAMLSTLLLVLEHEEVRKAARRALRRRKWYVLRDWLCRR